MACATYGCPRWQITVVLNVHQVTTSGGEFDIFFWHGQKLTKIPLRIFTKKPFQAQNSRFFLTRGPSPLLIPLSVWEGYPLLTPLPSRPTTPSGIRPCVPKTPARLARASSIPAVPLSDAATLGTSFTHTFTSRYRPRGADALGR